MYTGQLLEKYKYDGNNYRSTTTGSIFENMISYIKSDFSTIFKIWNSKEFTEVRNIDSRIREAYRKQSGGHGGYTFHSLSESEIKAFHDALFSKIQNLPVQKQRVQHLPVQGPPSPHL